MALPDPVITYGLPFRLGVSSGRVYSVKEPL